MKQLDITGLSSIVSRAKRLVAQLSAHSKIVFLVIGIGIIIYALISLNLIITMPSDQDYAIERDQIVNSLKFDQETIDRINKLNTDQSIDVYALPDGDINPFAE